MDEKQPPDLEKIDNPEVAHETTDINVRIVVGFGASLVVAAVIVHLLVWLLFDVFGGLNTASYPRDYPLAQAGEMRLPPAPRLQDKPREDLKQLRRGEDELLNSYTWIDQNTGAVRIPIGEAMKRVLDQGVPVADQPPQGQPQQNPK